MKLFRQCGGQALIEAVVVAPMLLLSLLGAAEFGRLCYAGIEVTNAAHSGVQYGAQNRATAADVAGIKAAALNEGTDLAKMDSHWTSTGVTSQVLCATSYNTAPGACSGTVGQKYVYVQVNTTVTVSSLFGGTFKKNYTLTGSATTRVAD